MRTTRRTLLLGTLGLVAGACGGSSNNQTATIATGTTTGAAPAAGTPPASRAATAAVASPTKAAGTTPVASPVAVSSGSATPSTTGTPVKVTLNTGFQPSMNFASFYLAAEKGYYADEGLDVTIKDGSNPGLLEQLAKGGMEFGITGGDTLIPARAQGIPVAMVLQHFQKYPVGLITLASGGSTISAPADLKGKKIGVSAPNGSTYYGLLALLQAGHLTTGDVQIISIGFTELEALTQKRVDGAMTFITNEPVQARDLGTPVNQLAVSDYVKLVSSGLVTSEQLVAQHPDVVQKFVEASMRGLAAAQTDPQAAYDATIKRMPDVTGDAAKTQRDILTATLGFEQQPAGHPYGWSDPQAWTTTVSFLKSAGVTQKDVDPTSCYTNRFVEAARPGQP